MSLIDRCRHFRKEFSSAKINPTLLRQVYRLNHIKKKKLKWFKETPDKDPSKIRQQLSTMKGLLTRAKNDGFRIIYIDETVFTRKTCLDSEWALKNDNMQVNIDKINEPTMALLCGISKENGLEHHMIFKKSVDADKFGEYIKALRHANPSDKICLFMDNLSVHRCEKSKDEMKKAGFRWILNIPYEPK